MRFHNITKDDMLNGDGLRVVLWVAGCEHHCEGCQNPITWDIDGGVLFDNAAYDELFEALDKSYISGLTLSGGDPLCRGHRYNVLRLCQDVKKVLPNKTIWLYTGYTWEQILGDPTARFIVELCDVLVDGRFVESRKDLTYPWAGSTNQRVIDVQNSLKNGCVVLHDSSKM